MLYAYTARNAEGAILPGKREAADKVALSRELRNEGLSLIIAHDAIRRFDFSVINHLLVRVKLHEKVIFTRNLSAMLHAGVSLARALGILERQTQNFKLKKILNSLVEDINKGQSLSDGMRKFPKVFSPLFISMIRAGEESGGLPDSLQAIGAQLEKSYVMGKKIRGAMMYPSIVLGAIFVIGTLMLIYVVPSITATFNSMGAELPGTTKFIIAFSDFLIDHTALFLISVLAAAAAVFMALRTKRGHKMWDFTVIRMPIFGNIAKEVNAARTARTLSSLLSAGVSMQESLHITEEVLQNHYYKDILSSAQSLVEKGFPVSSIFKSRSDLYPVMVGEMMEVGEETGKLSDMLDNIASFYEDEVDTTTKDLSSLIEPILMIVIGTAVGFFAIAMITPAYSILNSI